MGTKIEYINDNSSDNGFQEESKVIQPVLDRVKANYTWAYSVSSADKNYNDR